MACAMAVPYSGSAACMRVRHMCLLPEECSVGDRNQEGCAQALSTPTESLADLMLWDPGRCATIFPASSRAWLAVGA